VDGERVALRFAPVARHSAQAVPFCTGLAALLPQDWETTVSSLPSHAGIGFQKLFKLSRQKFLVGAEQNLKFHLAEFRDHGLLKER